MDTLEITAAELAPGMSIVEGRRSTDVKRVELAPVGCRHSVHVNRSMCYSAGDFVSVKS